jgi:hypothetical protein
LNDRHAITPAAAGDMAKRKDFTTKAFVIYRTTLMIPFSAIH